MVPFSGIANGIIDGFTRMYKYKFTQIYVFCLQVR